MEIIKVISFEINGSGKTHTAKVVKEIIMSGGEFEKFKDEKEIESFKKEANSINRQLSNSHEMGKLEKKAQKYQKYKTKDY